MKASARVRERLDTASDQDHNFSRNEENDAVSDSSEVLTCYNAMLDIAHVSCGGIHERLFRELQPQNGSRVSTHSSMQRHRPEAEHDPQSSC